MESKIITKTDLAELNMLRKNIQLRQNMMCINDATTSDILGVSRPSFSKFMNGVNRAEYKLDKHSEVIRGNYPKLESEFRRWVIKELYKLKELQSELLQYAKRIKDIANIDESEL